MKTTSSSLVKGHSLHQVMSSRTNVYERYSDKSCKVQTYMNAILTRAVTFSCTFQKQSISLW